MKLLLNENYFETFVHQLNNGSKRYNIDAKIELYSCKMVSEEKKQYGVFLNDLGLPENYNNNNSRDKNKKNTRSRSPHQSDSEVNNQPNLVLNSSQTLSMLSELVKVYSNENTDLKSPIQQHKNLQKAGTILPKDLFYLIGTLNSAFFPDYDFRKTKSSDFSAEPNFCIVERFISDFCSIYVNRYAIFKSEIWKLIDKEINLSACHIYSYRPDHKDDPYSTGCLASFNYFFYNRTTKRILFFSIRVLNDPISEDSDEDLYLDDD